MSTQRKFFVGGNWKMNGNLAKIDELVKMLNDGGVNANTGEQKNEEGANFVIL